MSRTAATPPYRPFTLDFERVGQIRRYRGISQAQLARSAGVTRWTVMRLEQGRKKNPSLKLVVSIARALGYPIHDLFTVIDARGEEKAA